jgi:hypothetical protein
MTCCRWNCCFSAAAGAAAHRLCHVHLACEGQRHPALQQTLQELTVDRGLDLSTATAATHSIQKQSVRGGMAADAVRKEAGSSARRSVAAAAKEGLPSVLTVLQHPHLSCAVHVSAPPLSPTLTHSCLPWSTLHAAHVIAGSGQ